MTTLLALVWLHFFADFMLQSDRIAVAKSADNGALALHVCLYTLPFLFFGVWFAMVNMLLHFATDFVSSRVASHFHQKGDRHNFFVTIGADQAVHMSCLILTASYFEVI